MRRLPLILFLILSAALALMLLNSTKEKDTASTTLTPFPALTLASMDGKTTWNTNDTKGRVTLINFYASWCTPCAAEMPELAALKKDFPALHLAGIAWNDDPKTLDAWLKKNGNPFHSNWLDAKGDATIDLGIKGIPETILVDSKGMIRFRLQGPLTEPMRKGEFGALITTLLAEAEGAR
jgi:cytochrome c biogenesis protein CcmG, thiol:disulfide interchange protein DsbE